MSEHLRKPDWLKIRLGGNEQFTRTKSIVESHCLHTICTSGKCPNMGECWSRGTATFMIAGDILPFLQYVDWQAAPVGPEGACECGGKHPTDEFETCGDYFCRPG